jgi:hypothetical protein
MKLKLDITPDLVRPPPATPWSCKATSRAADGYFAADHTSFWAARSAKFSTP